MNDFFLRFLLLRTPARLEVPGASECDDASTHAANANATTNDDIFSKKICIGKKKLFLTGMFPFVHAQFATTRHGNQTFNQKELLASDRNL